MEIERVHLFSDISNAYREMGNTFPDLEKRVDIHSYLEKLSQYANVYLIKDNGKVCAFSAIYLNDHTTKIAYLTLIGVHEKYRNKHLGTMLLAHCEKESIHAGMKQLKLEVNKDNLAAINLYKKNGFNILADASKTTYYMQKGLGV